MPLWLERILPRRLHRQLVVLFTLLFAGLMAFYACYTANEQYHFTLQILQRQADDFAVHLAADLALGQADRDFATVEHLAQGGKYQNLLSLALTDSQGRLLRRLSRDDQGRMHVNPVPVTLSLPGSGNAEATIVAWVPLPAMALGNQGAGWLRVDFDPAQAERARKHIIFSSLEIGILVTVCASILLAMFLRQPMASLARATEFAENLDKNFGSILEPHRAVAEVEQLVNALNWASIRLFDQHTAIQESEARKGAILQAALDCIISTDLDGRIIEFNPAAEATFGYRREDVMGRDMASLIVPPEYRAQHQRQMEHFIATGDYTSLGRRREVDALRNNGERFPVEIAVVPVDFAGRKHFTAYLRDISELRRSRRALESNEKRYRSVVENLSEMVFQTDAHLRWTYLNPAWEEMTHFSIAESLGRPVAEFFPSDDGGLFSEMLRPLLDGMMESRRAELRYLTRQGQPRWAEVFVRVLTDENGAVTGLAGSAIDIHERRQAEERLKDQLHFVQDLLEVIPNPIFFQDREGRFLGFNKAFETFAGIRRQSWINRTLFHLLPRTQAQFHDRKDSELLLHGGVLAYETRWENAQGEDRELLFHKAVFNRGDGSVAGIIGVLTDITDRKAAEAALTKAKETAEAANRAKSDFLANMSHEIRTPMNAIIGMTELALDTALDDEPREYLKMVKQSADALLNIINEILDFSKIEAGKLDLETIPFGLRDMLGLAVRTLAQKAAEKGLSLRFEAGGGVPDWLCGDPHRLRQILINLISNAIKFTPSGEVVVSVVQVQRDSNRVTLNFAVRDTGVGIPADKQQVIFEAFSQADSSTTRHYGGTGLGLAISTRLARSMGGKLSVTSEPGHGSTFSFTAVLTLPDENQIQPLASECLENLPVLVVAADQTQRLFAADLLASWRMHAECVTSIAAAQALLHGQGGNYRLILWDQTDAAELDHQAWASLNADLATPVPIIMMQPPQHERGDPEHNRKLGVAAYLRSPVVPSELLDAIMLVLGGEVVTEAQGTADGQVPAALSVLLAEDNAVNRTLAVRILEKLGHRVAIAENGREAVARWRDAGPGGFDVILMDVQMPVLSGFEAVAEIRAQERQLGWFHTPVIAMTAHALAGDRERCLDAGMDDYVSKPIQTSALTASLARMVTRHGGEQSAQQSPDGQRLHPSIKVFNRQALMDNIGGDEDLYAQLVDMFLDTQEGLVRDLDQALAGGDLDRVYATTHAIKGTVANFSAERAVKAAQAVEKCCRTGNADAVGSLAADLASAVQELVLALRWDREGKH